jgi:nitroreductase
MADNCVFDSVRTVLAVRDYSDKPVPDDVLHRIVEAGRLSASAQNLQPWRFVVVRDRDTILELGRIVRTGPYIAGAPLAIAVAVERNKPTAMSDASRAIQSMMLTAWAEGVGSNWTGFGSMDAVARLLGVPDTHEVVGVLPFGYPKKKMGLGRKNRKALSEVASAERFDQPFE